MSLKIIPATDPLPVNNLVLTLYSAPGLWKTSIGFTAEKPVLIDADKGSHRAANKKDRVIVNSWEDVISLVADDIAPYSTVLFDTAGTLITKLMTWLIAQDPKNAGSYGGMSGKGWGNVNRQMETLVDKVLSAKKDLVFICHMEEQEKSGDIVERIDASGKPRNTIYRLSDAMCRIVINPDGTKFLDFDPRSGGYGKNPAQLPKIAIPTLYHFIPPDDPNGVMVNDNPDFLANIIARIKYSLNRQTEIQAEAVKRQQEWEQAAAKTDKADECAKLVRVANEQKSIVGVDLMMKRLFEIAPAIADFNTHVIPLMKDGIGKTLGASEAKRRAYTADKTTGLYVEPKAEVKP